MGRKKLEKTIEELTEFKRRESLRKSLWYEKNKLRLKQKHIKYYYEHIDENRKRGREYYYKVGKPARLNFPNVTLKERFKIWKRQAVIRNHEFALTFEDIESRPLKCYYTGLILTTETNKINTISLDRIDSTKGYIKDNVALCCAAVNIMKNDLSYDEFINLCENVFNYSKNKIK